ncbi:MAG: DVU_1557 family redox protein [Desulfitobacteriia bacterium]|jgi:predicted amidophosphoribosyltransferase
MGQEKLICCKCDRDLELAEVSLEYLGHKMTHQFLACPQCKQVYISEDIVTGKMRTVEQELEDK